MKASTLYKIENGLERIGDGFRAMARAIREEAKGQEALEQEITASMARGSRGFGPSPLVKAWSDRKAEREAEEAGQRVAEIMTKDLDEASKAQKVTAWTKAWIERFPRWWAFYPRKEKKRRAEAFWVKLGTRLRRLGLNEPEAFEAVLWLTLSRAAEWKVDGRERKTIPHPSSFINSEAFEDYTAVARGDTRASLSESAEPGADVRTTPQEGTIERDEDEATAAMALGMTPDEFSEYRIKALADRARRTP